MTLSILDREILVSQAQRRQARSPWRWGATVASLTVAALLGGATPAAAEPATPSADDVAGVAQLVAPDVDPAELSATSGGGYMSEGTRADVTIPANVGGTVVVTGASGFPVSIGVPGSSLAATGELSSVGSVVYQEAVGTTAVVVEPLEGGVRIQTIIYDDQALKLYEYSLGAGVEPVLNPDGSVDLIASFEGISLGVGRLAAPWAFDALGTPVPTHFVAAPGRVIQVIDTSGADYAYPIVADPMYQGDCGIVTCTSRFDRATTRNIRDGLSLSAIAVGVSSYFAGVTAVILAGVLATHQVFASRYYENGNCYGLKRVILSGIFTPTQVTRGTYNCK